MESYERVEVKGNIPRSCLLHQPRSTRGSRATRCSWRFLLPV